MDIMEIGMFLDVFFPLLIFLKYLIPLIVCIITTMKKQSKRFDVKCSILDELAESQLFPAVGIGSRRL